MCYEWKGVGGYKASIPNWLVNLMQKIYNVRIGIIKNNNSCRLRRKLLLLGVTYFGDESMRSISWNTCNMWKTFKLGNTIYDKNACTLL